MIPRMTLEDSLEDFPKSEIWRLQTDGCQSNQGPNNFRPEFYKGMDSGFQFISRNINAQITPELIEGIYHSAFQFESEYKNEDDLICRKGYAEEYNTFPLFLPFNDLKGIAGVSKDGLDELIVALKEFYNNKGERKYPQCGISIRIKSNAVLRINPRDYDDKNLKEMLLAYCWNAALSLSEIPVLTDFDQTIVEMVSYKATRNEILQWVQADIDKFQKELSAAKAVENPEQRKNAEINAINHFVRKLHQSHYFPDGNGRTFIFLLANLLLLQNGHGMKITENPAHYAAYSSEELLLETLHDMQHFNEYKITRAKNYLSGLKSTNINFSRNLVKQQLLTEHISADPLIAMAQINELYEQIIVNRFSIPEEFTPTTTNSLIISARETVLDLLKEAYVNKLEELAENVTAVDEDKRLGYFGNGSYKKETAGEVLQTLIRTQKIFESCDIKTINTLIESYNEHALGSTLARVFALYYAAEQGNVDTLKKLLRKLNSDEINIKDKRGRSVLHYAAKNGNIEIISLLLDAKVNINEKDNDHWTAIDISYEYKNLSALEMLLDANANIGPKILNEIHGRKDESTLLKILSTNKNISFNKEAFLVAMRIGSLKAIELFLNAGMNINDRFDKYERTPLMIAIDSDNRELVDYLLQKKADTNLTDKYGNTCLHYVVKRMNHNQDAVDKILATNKKLIDNKNDEQLTPLFILAKIAKINDHKVAKILLDNGANINVRDKDENTILHAAMTNTNILLIHEIITKDKSLIDKVNLQGRNPLHHAVSEMNNYSASEEKEKILIELYEQFFRGSFFSRKDLNIQDKNGVTLLEIALYKNLYDLSIRLIKDGAQTNISEAKNYLQNIKVDNILSPDFENNLINMINKGPLIALAQLNDLYVQIEDNCITNTEAFSKKYGISFFKKDYDRFDKARQKILMILEKKYAEDLKKIPYQNDKVLLQLIQSQKISQNIKTSTEENLIKTSRIKT